MTGTVKWFNYRRGYGFIGGDDDKDVFVHYTGIISEKKFKSLKAHDHVTYELGEDETGRVCAKDVTVVTE